MNLKHIVVRVSLWQHGVYNRKYDPIKLARVGSGQRGEEYLLNCALHDPQVSCDNTFG